MTHGHHKAHLSTWRTWEQPFEATWRTWHLEPTWRPGAPGTKPTWRDLAQRGPGTPGAEPTWHRPGARSTWHPTWRKADLALTWRSAHLAHLAPSATWQHLSDYEDSAIYLIMKLRIWKGHGICQVESTTRIARSPTNPGGPGRISDLALQIPRPGDRARSGQVVSK